MLLAAMGVVTVALMPMLLESSISAAQRDRPALAAGAMWLATHVLVVLFAVIASSMREHGAMDCRGETDALRQEASEQRERSLDRIKWICVVSIGAGFAASVSALLLSSRFASLCLFLPRCNSVERRFNEWSLFVDSHGDCPVLFCFGFLCLPLKMLS
jgi:hypothetical protein